MTPSPPALVDLADADCLELVGGKAVNLARMIRAGLPVPGGFVVTTAAYRDARSGGELALPEDLAETVVAAWRQMGSPAVAVRSSATAEDMAEASMAGQYETVLDVTDERIVTEVEVVRARNAYWNSLMAAQSPAQSNAEIGKQML